MKSISAVNEPQQLQECFACLQPFGLKGTHFQTCDACRQFMKAGIICIGVSDDAPSDRILDYGEAKVYRDGNWCVVTEDRVERVRRGVYRDGSPRRYVFIRHETWMRLGLPRAGKVGASSVRKGKYIAMAED